MATGGDYTTVVDGRSTIKEHLAAETWIKGVIQELHLGPGWDYEPIRMSVVWINREVPWNNVRN
jgi:hypothetical protein